MKLIIKKLKHINFTFTRIFLVFYNNWLINISKFRPKNLKL